MNLHASQVEKIAVERGLRVEKRSREWRITGADNKTVIYLPTTGVCVYFDTRGGRTVRDELRGSPERIVEIIQGFVS